MCGGDAGFGGLGVKAAVGWFKAAVGWYVLPLGCSLDLMVEACQGATATDFTVQRLARPYAIDSKPQDLQRQTIGGNHTRSEEALSPKPMPSSPHTSSRRHWQCHPGSGS